VSIFSNVEHSVVVSSRTMLADGVVALEFVAANRRDLPPWTPGSHIDLILAENVERQYSLCSDPTRRSTWRVAVLYEADGNGGSDRVHSGFGGRVTTSRSTLAKASGIYSSRAVSASLRSSR
jgi:ferredoxin-NADP reductase